MTSTQAPQTGYDTLLDALACRYLHETYSFAEITRDPDLFASVWTEDAVFGSVEGRAAIREAAVAFLQGMESITDLRISPAGWHVDVDGDEARGDFFVVSQLKVPQADGSVRILHMDASYRARFRRTSEGWRISQMGGIKNPSIFHDTDITAQLAHEVVSF
ncbi:MAG: nuclear transport factor 2 family protein [Acidimicrobiia bacterium]